METEIELIIEKGANLKLHIAKMVSSYDYPNDKKSLLLLAYHSLVFEHHSSIHLLIQKKLIGSSFALVRVLFETLYRAHWVISCATKSQIERIVTGKKKVFPTTNKMLDEIDGASGSDGFWREIMFESWPAMNDYTHSGILQLARRFKGSEVMPDYELGEIIKVLNGSNMAWLLMAHLFFFFFGKSKERERIESMILGYSKEQIS